VKILCVTSCYTGLVHTYLASEALTQAGENLGLDVLVETQGSAGSAPFTVEEIVEADGVLFATDIEVVGRERFADKPYLESSLRDVISAPVAVLGRLVSLIGDGAIEKVPSEMPATHVNKDAPVHNAQRGFWSTLFGRGH
jgi:fructose-specific phosphotransferase system IIB component